MLSALLLLVISTLLLIYLYRFSKQRPPNFPPGPPRLPIWGSYFLVLLNNFKFTHKGYHNLAEKYRTKILGLHLGPFPTVVVNSYELIREVLLRPEFQGRVKLPIINERTYDKNLGIIFTDGLFWEQQRRFSLRHMRDYGFGRRFPQLEAIGQEEIQDMLDLLNGQREDKEISKNGHVRLPDLFYNVFFNPIWFIITGQRFPVKDHAKLRYFTRQALRHQRSIDVTGNALVLSPWLKHIAPNYFGYTDLMESTGNMLRYIKDAVKEHMATYSEDFIRDFTDKFLMEMKKYEHVDEPTTFMEEQLRVVGLDYLFPASTTVTATLNFTIVHLLHHPEVQEKMQNEIDMVVGRNRLPTLDDRSRLPYNEAVLRESMRKETLVPLSVVHRATESTELGGYTIPKDTLMVVNLWSFHNDPEFWEDPEVYRPERFLDVHGQLLKKDYSLPFGAGKRLCAGETYSRHFMFLTLSALMQNFTVKGVPGKPLPTMEPDRPGIIVTKNDFWVRFEPRE
ncbi:probable cytochrome P450 304a1 [Periplaneta americana]|uniref:probable cytochrome P450 304a1 n=1 Tax=Periplaneta americana TaxID=6978 RepID=UPI0037E707CE